MTDIEYSEHVTIPRPGQGPKVMSLAQAVQSVATMKSIRDRRQTAILRAGEPLTELAEIEAIYSRSDFPTFN